MGLIYLSYELSPESPVFGENAAVVVELDHGFDVGPYQQHLVSFVNHSGTHVDFPAHFYPHGKTLSNFPASAWVFVKPAELPVLARGGLPVVHCCVDRVRRHWWREANAAR